MSQPPQQPGPAGGQPGWNQPPGGYPEQAGYPAPHGYPRSEPQSGPSGPPAGYGYPRRSRMPWLFVAGGVAALFVTIILVATLTDDTSGESTRPPSQASSDTETKYTDVRFTFGGRPGVNDLTCKQYYAGLSSESGPRAVEETLEHGDFELVIASCRNGPASLTFGANFAVAVDVRGFDQDKEKCRAAARASDQRLHPEIPLSRLTPGQQFCIVNRVSESTELVRVESAAPEAGTVTFLVTAWK
jgi:hypothetical protein